MREPVQLHVDGLDGFSAKAKPYLSGRRERLFWRALSPFEYAQVALLVAAACAGFLIWNWPPAKIFMGDSGSGFLGFCFAMFAAASLNQQGFYVWPILLSVFICDSTVTLVSRMANGERWSEPHNTHAFQVLAKRLGHMKVTLGLWLGNICLVLPVAWAAATTPYGLWLCLWTVFGAWDCGSYYPEERLSHNAALLSSLCGAKQLG